MADTQKICKLLEMARSLYQTADSAEEEADQYLNMAREAGASDEDVEQMFAEAGRYGKLNGRQ